MSPKGYPTSIRRLIVLRLSPEMVPVVRESLGECGEIAMDGNVLCIGVLGGGGEVEAAVLYRLSVHNDHLVVLDSHGLVDAYRDAIGGEEVGDAVGVVALAVMLPIENSSYIDAALLGFDQRLANGI